MLPRSWGSRIARPANTNPLDELQNFPGGLNDFADFLIQVGEGGFEGFAVLRVGG